MLTHKQRKREGRREICKDREGRKEQTGGNKKERERRKTDKEMCYSGHCCCLPRELGELPRPRWAVGKGDFPDVRETHGGHPGPVVQLVGALDQDVGAVRADDGHQHGADHPGCKTGVLEGIRHR